MLDHHSHQPHSGEERSEHLFLQAIWCLEGASESHGKISSRVKRSNSNFRQFEGEVTATGHNIERALDNLSILHLRLFKCETLNYSQLRYCPSPRRSTPRSERYRVLKRRTLLWREDALCGRPGVDPRLLQLCPPLNHTILKSERPLGNSITQPRFFDSSVHESGIISKTQMSKLPVLITRSISRTYLPLESSSLKIPIEVQYDMAGKPVSLTLTLSETRGRPITADEEVKKSKAEEHKAREHDDNTAEEITHKVEIPGYDHSAPPCADLDDSYADEAVPVVVSGDHDAFHRPISQAVVPHFHLSTISLNILLKQLRRSLEERYEMTAGGIPVELIELYHKFEVHHQLERHPSTNSIWNFDHHLQRTEVFEACDIGIAYRQKCVCGKGADGIVDGILHSLDVYCPRNIPYDLEEIDEHMEWDSAELEWRKKKTARPSTPAKIDPEDENIEPEEQEGEDPVLAWKREKKQKEDTIDKCVKKITNLVGLQNVKDHLCKLRRIIETAGRQGIELKEERFGTIFLGNTGTGKTTVARSYAKYLSASGVVPGHILIEKTGTQLANGGIIAAKHHIEKLLQPGGVLFVDEAHRLVSRNHQSGGKKVLDFLLDEVETHRGKVVFVFAGTEKGMRQLMGEGNQNVGSLLPYVLSLKDFTDEELVKLLSGHIEKRFDGKMKIEGEPDGLYLRIAARRLGRNRVGTSFGNARAVENLFVQIWERQAARLEKRRFEKAQVKSAEMSKVGEQESDEEANAGAEKPAEEEAEDLEDYNFTKEDILGPAPTDAILESEAWKKLQRLTGLKTVKESIMSIFELTKTNYQRELEEKPLIQLSFNRLFLGPPGTGKTVVAKLYGQILAEVGVLSNGELIIRNPSDFIGQFIGDSEANTKAALSAAKGNVLVIDEAYMMYTGGSDGTGNVSDCFRKAVVDTLISEVQNVPGEDRCVLLLGYGDQMQEMLQNGNPGLARRFPIADAFWFENFTMDELESILRTKLDDNVVDATEEAIKVAMCVLDKARSRLNFGNGGEVENLITKAKTNYQTRISVFPVASRPVKWMFEPQDFDPDFDRGKSATLNLHKLFSDVIGCESIVQKLEGYQRVSQAMKLKNMDPKGFIPTNFVFKGPPGTGKTTTARKIAQVYYDMGFLSEVSLVECSASDLVGKYTGHSGPKTVKVLERGLGKVLFIDEAYRLASGNERNSFNSEVISELVDCLTKPKFFGKVVVILAGYEGEMNHLLSINPGLASRFPEELIFHSMAPKHCLQVLKMKLQATNIAIPVVDDVKSADYRNLIRLIRLLIETPSWGNARDVETLAKGLCRVAFMSIQNSEDELVCTAEMAAATFEILLLERRARGGRSISAANRTEF